MFPKNVQDDSEEFYKLAALEIYNWLNEDKKIKVALELFAQGFSGLTDMNPKESLLFMLNFLDNNFIKQEELGDNLLLYLEEIIKHPNNVNFKEPIKIKLIDYPLERLVGVMKEKELKNNFRLMLKETGLSEDYEKYTKKGSQLTDESERYK